MLTLSWTSLSFLSSPSSSSVQSRKSIGAPRWIHFKLVFDVTTALDKKTRFPTGLEAANVVCFTVQCSVFLKITSPLITNLGDDGFLLSVEILSSAVLFAARWYYVTRPQRPGISECLASCLLSRLPEISFATCEGSGSDGRRRLELHDGTVGH